MDMVLEDPLTIQAQNSLYWQTGCLSRVRDNLVNKWSFRQAQDNPDKTLSAGQTQNKQNNNYPLGRFSQVPRLWSSGLAQDNLWRDRDLFLRIPQHIGSIQYVCCRHFLEWGQQISQMILYRTVISQCRSAGTAEFYQCMIRFCTVQSYHGLHRYRTVLSSAGAGGILRVIDLSS
jgi:hypothetical protein